MSRIAFNQTRHSDALYAAPLCKGHRCALRYALLRHILSFEWRKLKKAKGKIYVEFR